LFHNQSSVLTRCYHLDEAKHPADELVGHIKSFYYLWRNTVTKRYKASSPCLFIDAFTAIGFPDRNTSLRGLIKDPSGAVALTQPLHLPAMQMDIDQSNVQQTQAILLNQIPPATYTITVSAAGFADQKNCRAIGKSASTIDFTESVQTMMKSSRKCTAQTLNTTDASG